MFQENRDGPYVIEHGDVWYHERAHTRPSSTLRHVCGANEELAIAHDGQMLLKIGSAASVEKWLSGNKDRFDLMNESLRAIGGEAVEIVVVRLPVSQAIVDEMNACVATTGRVSKLEENLARIGEQDPSLFGRPRYPH